jgi:hypothetical protein
LTEFPDVQPSDQDILDLVQKCKGVCADTEDAEIADFVRLKGSTLKAEAIRTSRMALLLKIVPQCLTGETLVELEAIDRFWEETLRDSQRTAENRRNAMGYFVGVIERADSTPERRKRAEDAIQHFRAEAGAT